MKNCIVETYFPVYQKGTYLHNVLILITLVNESDMEYLPITRLQYTMVTWDDVMSMLLWKFDVTWARHIIILVSHNLLTKIVFLLSS